MGMDLRSPLLLGDCCMADDVEHLRRVVDEGVGAVVLRPLLEEEMIWDIKLNGREVAPVVNYGKNLKEVADRMPNDYVARYFDFVSVLKDKLGVPVIGSVDCFSFNSWISYLRRFEEAGCAAVEFNVRIMPFDSTIACDDIDRLFGDLVSTSRRVSSLPISFRVTPFFSDLCSFMLRLSWMGGKNITLFSLSEKLDIDIETGAPKIVQARINNDNDTLLWLSVLYKRVNCSLTSMVYGGDTDYASKALLSGASALRFDDKAVQCDAAYMHSVRHAIEQVMERMGCSKLSELVGRSAPDELRHGFQDIRAFQFLSNMHGY